MLSNDDIDKICGGVYGKIIGVRLGIPFECRYSPAFLQQRYKSINTYPVSSILTMPDDDCNGFVFFAKVFDKISSLSELKPEHAADIILNAAWENRGFFWNYKSQEVTAYHDRLHRKPIPAPGDGSDFVGGQIFYDAAGLVFAGEPAPAAECAETLSRVMHAGEGRLGARFICACIAKAFDTNDPEEIVRTALNLIDPDSEYAAMVRTVTDFHRRHPDDWKLCSRMIEDTYDDCTAAGCASHIVTALLYGNGIFSYSMEICLLSGGDTDCNCGNLGTILGVMCGVHGISRKRWIDPINDVLYCSSALPYENEVSVTEFAAYLIRCCAKFRHETLPDYLQRRPEQGELRFLFPFSTQGFLPAHFRENTETGEYLPVDDVFPHDNLDTVCEPIPTPPSGSPYTLKFWADCVKRGNNYRLYRFSSDGLSYRSIPVQPLHDSSTEDAEPHYPIPAKYEPTCCTKYLPGLHAQVHLYSNYNTCDMAVRFVAYSSLGKSVAYSPEVRLSESGWTLLEWELPAIAGYAADCLNLEIIPQKDTCYRDGYDGLDLYIDGFRIFGTPRMHLIPLPDMLNSKQHFPSLANFSVGIGDVYIGACQDRDVFRFYCGSPLPTVIDPVYQELAAEKKMSAALFGCRLQSVRISCEMQIAPPDCGKESDWCFDASGASMLIVAAKGAAEHFAVGFCGAQAGIFRCSGIPGEYTALSTEAFTQEPYERYQMTVTVTNDTLRFSANTQHRSVSREYAADAGVLTGYTGFVSLKNGFTLYHLTLEPV